MPRRVLTATATFAMLTASTTAAADPTELPNEHVIVESDGVTLVVPKDDGPHIFDIHIGTHILARDSWERLDEAYKKLEDSNTRLDAENKSFRETMKSWQPGWRVLLTTLIVGVAGGVYIGTRF